MESCNKIFQASIMASAAHQGQKRKGTDIPYISHPMSVAIILAENGASTNVVIAGLLHDTVEDGGIRLEEIRDQFGEHVAGSLR